ncbi:hypothetical protein RJP21_23745 [Paenibacillus sp. VCA1]|uniref:hypothetical protein n=1 Tax=Paenibacillus sp. VCA1 TaxID=3039148 RepID=UPI002870ED74|nr:hypothetical protein [Paenibacillus sp. VCA1]MDR9856621.1 hypothetical protein [Paenibacillus sp. VCA1]
MSFMDEKIAQFLNEAEQAMSPNSICDGPVKIGGRYFEFTEQAFYEDKLKVFLPKDFEEMPQQARSVKYPYEQRPEIIQSDASGSTNFTFNRIDHELQDEMVEELTSGMKMMIQKSNPSHVFYESGVEVVNGKPIGFFEFKSIVFDGSLFNIMYFLELEGRILMGTFCCRYEEYADWRDIAYQVIRTVTVIQEEKEDQA